MLYLKYYSYNICYYFSYLISHYKFTASYLILHPNSPTSNFIVQIYRKKTKREKDNKENYFLLQTKRLFLSVNTTFAVIYL